MKTLLAFVLLFTTFVFLLDRSLRSKGYRGPVSTHFDGVKFLNITHGLLPPSPGGSFWRFARWILTRRVKSWVGRSVPQVVPKTCVEGSELIVTLINHATVLIQTEGVNIITDPMYSKRASPFSFLGPKRHVNPGIAFEDLPPIDVILISHNHYDHLDIPTLTRLVKRNNPRIFVPLGNKEFLLNHGITNVIELDWWETSSLSKSVPEESTDEAYQNMAIDCVPAQHFSARAFSDRNTTLWCGYVIRTPHGDLYFAGDTGLGPFVDQIAEVYPAGFRLGFLPIGAFLPRWAMQSVHTGPIEALAMQKQLRIKEAVAIHFGTFALADDGQDEPAHLLKALIMEEKIQNTFHLLENGGNISVSSKSGQS